MGNIIKTGDNAYLNEQMDDCITKSTEASEKVAELTSDVASFRSQMEAMSTSPEENELTNIRAGYDGVLILQLGKQLELMIKLLTKKLMS